MSAVLAIDLGTSGVKVAIFDRVGRVLASADERYETVFTADGGATQDAEVWWQAIGRCARRICRDAAPVRVDTIAVTSQYMSALGIDRHGVPVTPVRMWIEQCGGLVRPNMHDGDAFMAGLMRHGLPPLPNDDAAHVAMIRSLDSSADDRVAAYVEPADALTARLTGRITATQTTAFGFNAIDNTVWGATAYDPELLTFAGLNEDRLAPLLGPGEPVGLVTADAAAHLGVPATALVLAGSVDSITSAVGTGGIHLDRCGLIVGTTAVLATHVPDNRSDLGHSLAAMPSPLHDQYLVMAENGVGGRALDLLVRDVIYADDACALGPMPSDAFERASAVAATVKPGSDGVLFLPWLVGSMAPVSDDDVRGGFVNVSLSTMHRGHLIRAVMEGVAHNAAWLLPHVEALTGQRYSTLTMGGGAANSEVWCQIMADVLGRTIDRLAEPGLANARGAALLAGVQRGHLTLDETAGLLPVAAAHEPNADAGAVYAGAQPMFEQFHGATSMVLRSSR